MEHLDEQATHANVRRESSASSNDGLTTHLAPRPRVRWLIQLRTRFVGANAVVTVLCYLFVVGDIKRMVLTPPFQLDTVQGSL